MNDERLMQNNNNKAICPTWITKSLFVIHCSLFLSISATAQTFTERLQKSSGTEGRVTLHQDKAIDELVNAPVVVSKKQPVSTPPTSKPADKASDKTADKASPKKDTPPAVPKADTSQENDTTAATATPRNTRRVMGYRVQAFAGRNTRNDRQKAQQTAGAIRALFPGEKVETHFINPRWLCLVGNYTTYAEAQQMQSELRKLGYSSATIIKTRVTVPL